MDNSRLCGKKFGRHSWSRFCFLGRFVGWCWFVGPYHNSWKTDENIETVAVRVVPVTIWIWCCPDDITIIKWFPEKRETASALRKSFESRLNQAANLWWRHNPLSPLRMSPQRGLSVGSNIGPMVKAVLLSSPLLSPPQTKSSPPPAILTKEQKLPQPENEIFNCSGLDTKQTKHWAASSDEQNIVCPLLATMNKVGCCLLKAN